MFKAFLKPDDLEKRQLEYHSRGLLGGIMAAIYWSSIFIYFWLIDATQLLVPSAISCLVFYVFLYFWHQRKYTFSWVFGNINLCAIVSYLTLELGWNAGFQFVLLSSVIFAEVDAKWNHKILSYVPVVGVVVFSVLGFLTFDKAANFSVPEGHAISLFMINIVSPLLGPVLAQRTYSVNTSKLEEQLKKSLEENEKLLHNILPKEVAKELRDTGSVSPARFEEVSIMFADFKGFTNIVATIPTRKLIEELNDIFSHFDDIMEDEGIEKIQTVGDGYLAACGLPVPEADHAIRCVRAGKKMIHFLNERNEANAIKWNVRIGIHSGPISAGVIGKKKFAYDIFGDAINTASRIESNGEAGRINVSAYTYDLIKETFPAEYRGKVNAKGKGELDMYFLE